MYIRRELFPLSDLSLDKDICSADLCPGVHRQVILWPGGLQRCIWQVDRILAV